MLGWPPTWSRLLLLPALFLGFTVHELAHALVAYLLGDTSQVERKRLSWNPLRHVSVLGMAAFLLIGLGWAKPVWVDYGRLRIKNRALGVFLVSISGAAANALTGLAALLGMSLSLYLVWALSGVEWTAALRTMLDPEAGFDVHGLVLALSYYVIAVNFLLAAFNLLPIPPLDGFQAVVSLFSMASGPVRGRPKPSPSPGLKTAPRVHDTRPGSESPAQIHFAVGVEYQRQGLIDEAIARYRQAIDHDGNFGPAFYNLGLAYWSKGRFDLAAAAFRTASRLPGDAYVRDQAYQRLRELELAQRDPQAKASEVPPVLDLGDVAGVSAGQAAPLDPALARRVWLRLAVGAAALLVLAFMAWLFVTAATLVEVTPP